MNKAVFIILLLLSLIWAIVVIPLSLLVMCTIILTPVGFLMFGGAIAPISAVIAAYSRKKKVDAR